MKILNLKFLGRMDFGILLLILMILLMGVATFIEARFGAEMAKRLIYYSYPFLALEFLFFVSLFFSFLHHLPFRKRLLPFYFIHGGILFVLVGAFVTFFGGVSGEMRLSSQGESSHIVMPWQMLSLMKKGRPELQIELPRTLLEKKWDNFSFGPLSQFRFYPYARLELDMQKSSNQSFLEVLVKNKALALSYDSQRREFSPLQSIGQWQIIYFPASLKSCLFKLKDFVVLDFESERCYYPYEFEVQRTVRGNRFFRFRQGLNFFPEMVAFPLDDRHQMVSSRIYVVSKKQLKERRLFLISLEGVFYFDGEKSKIAKLGDFDFPFDSVAVHQNKRPVLSPSFSFSGEPLLAFNRGDDQFFLKSNDVFVEGDYQVRLSSKRRNIGMSVFLDRFEIEHNIGGEFPSHFSSFVRIDGGDLQKIAMNSPLRIGDFSLYQSSYFQDSKGFGSILVLNYDPGRWIKYFGSLLLIVGVLFYYFRGRSV